MKLIEMCHTHSHTHTRMHIYTLEKQMDKHKNDVKLVRSIEFEWMNFSSGEGEWESE